MKQNLSPHCAECTISHLLMTPITSPDEQSQVHKYTMTETLVDDYYPNTSFKSDFKKLDGL